MKRLKSTSGLTIAELLIAALIVGIIMLGIVSIDLALRQSERGSSRDALVASRATSMILHITKHVEQAAVTEDASGFNRGIIADTSQEKLWINMECDIDAGAVCSPDDSDNQWICYDTSGDTLRYCHVTSASDDCDSPIGGTLENLGSVDVFEPEFVTDSDTAAQNFYVRVRLVNRYDMSKAADPLDNPDYEITTRIYPNVSSF